MSRRRCRCAERARRAVTLAGIGLLAAAVARELRRPAGEREWHGRLAGAVPYDLRPPTPARVRERLWSPDEPRVLVPTIFGVGWSVNVGRLVALVRGRLRPAG